MLDIVGDALKRNEIKFVGCKNKVKDFQHTGAIEIFRNSPEIHVLLLPLAMGAEGLDLIVASHIFLLEPLVNRQQEMQAVNRIYRIGQAKRTYIHKYIISNTVEENIKRFQQNQSDCDNEGSYNDHHSKALTVQKGLKKDDGSLSLDDIQIILFG
jgi:E3 ubiquitin-protein ligase SHPRH